MSRGRWSRNQVLLVCDGVLPRGHRDIRRGGIGTIHSGADKEADDIIEEIIARSDAPSSMLVISFGSACCACSKETQVPYDVPPRCFSAHSPMTMKKQVIDGNTARMRRDLLEKLSRKSVEDWRIQFDIDGDDIAEFAKLDEASRAPVKKTSDNARQAPPPSPGTPRVQVEPPLPDHIIEEAMRMLEEDDA